jgi:hypothetical protein
MVADDQSDSRPGFWENDGDLRIYSVYAHERIKEHVLKL